MASESDMVNAAKAEASKIEAHVVSQAKAAETKYAPYAIVALAAFAVGQVLAFLLHV